MVAALLDFAYQAGFGFSSVVSTGAGSDVEFSEILDFLALDGATRSIILYVEGVHDARAFMSSVRAAASVEPVVVLKVGRHLAGSKAAMSHTGALVGDDAVFDIALRRAGAIRVSAYTQMFSAAEVLAAGRFPRSEQANRLAIVTNGGGPAVLAADAAAQLGLQVGPVADLGEDAPASAYLAALQAAVDDRSVDGVLVIHAPKAGGHGARSPLGL